MISTGKFPTSFQEFIYIRTYSRWVEEIGRRETWPETVQRYTNFIQKNLGDKLTTKELNDINKAILNFEVMPSMRALWAAGGAADADNLALYNCSFIAIEELKNFAEILYILMNGTGAGFTVEKEFISKLPVISEETRAGKPDVIVFEDSKIGWAQGFEEVLNCLWKGIPFECDYSKIRARGARLKTMGGRASGPEPLKDLVRFVTNIAEANRGHQIQSIDAHDICCKIADIVVVGGVRRCLNSNYLIQINKDEWTELNKLKVNDKIYFDEKFYNVNNVWKETSDIMIKILTNEGYHTCTPEHRWMVYNFTSKQIEETSAEDINKNPTNFAFLRKK